MHLDAPQPFTLELGWLRDQAFRWSEPHDDGWFYGVIDGNPVKVRHADGGMEFRSNVPEESIAERVKNYFRLDLDIELLYWDFVRHAPELLPMFDKGTRVLRQDPWECLVAYVCSQNNSVKRIAEIVTQLADTYGEHQELDGVQLNAFPTPQRLADVGAKELEGLGFGLQRGRKIWTVARDVSNRKLDLDELARGSYDDARERLKKYPGIGPKIADCVCLFALDKPEAFPMDMHIGTALEDMARERYGENAGYAGQLLFQGQRAKNETK